MMTPPEVTVEAALDRCLTRIGKGEAMDACLTDFPDFADELRPLLEMAVQARTQRPSLSPRSAFVRTSEVRLRNLLRSRAHSSARPQPARPRLWLPQRTRQFAPVALAAALVAALSLGALGVVSASAGALPGDGLYLVKRWVEELRLALTFNAQSEADLLGALADERLEEITTVTDEGRLEDLEAALQGYAVSVGSLAHASLEVGQGGSEEVMEKLTWHITVLEEVQSHVPAPAQEAIEQVIESSIDAETEVLPGEDPGPGPDCPASGAPGCPPAGPPDHDTLMAEQIAKIYGVTVEQALAVYQGECALDWKCVREHFRGPPPGQEKDKKPHP